MKQVRYFEDLEVWQAAPIFAKRIFEITDSEKFKWEHRLTEQMHASSGSIMDNIAEGYERNGNKEFINFLYYSKGSCGEIRSQLTRCLDVGLISEDDYKILRQQAIEISVAIYNLINSIYDSGFKGVKYCRPNEKAQ